MHARRAPHLRSRAPPHARRSPRAPTAQELDAAFREVLGNEWTIKSDERVKYVGKLEVEQDNTTLKVSGAARAARPRGGCGLTPVRDRPRAQVTMEDYPEAGMSALKYYTVQTFTK